MHKIKTSEITPEELYLSRRDFLKGAGILSASAMLLAACGTQAASPTGVPTKNNPTLIPTDNPAGPVPEVTPTTDLSSQITSYEAITNYNNYYEFSIDKGRVAVLAKNFRTSPWEVEVGGLVNKPKVYDLDDLSKFALQERIYRLRCVEGWSMIIPWMGFPLADLLNDVEPTSDAKFVRFETLYDPDQYPGQRNNWYPWPYVEGLRLDEAMNDLAILSTGLYGKPLTSQNGAPVRMVIPWKYGFKSIKAIVKIELVDTMPTSLWMSAAPYEYGFYANVNPNVPHPRWSQASERRIGEVGRRTTLMFNGYEEEVAYLYDGMDLKANY